MSGYIGSKASVTVVSPETDSRYVNVAGDTMTGGLTVPSMTSTGAITASGGVYLGGTGSANYLDDYEEGTWTPYLANGFSATYTQQSGRYTKIGRAVHIQGVIRWSAFTPSGNLALGGLPFIPEGTADFINSVSIFPANGTSYQVAYEYLSGGVLFFYDNSGSLGGSATSNPFGSSGSIIINGIYYA